MVFIDFMFILDNQKQYKMKSSNSDNYNENKLLNNTPDLQSLIYMNSELNMLDMIGIENMRLSSHFRHINAPKTNNKVEINAGNYIIR